MALESPSYSFQNCRPMEIEGKSLHGVPLVIGQVAGRLARVLVLFGVLALASGGLWLPVAQAQGTKVGIIDVQRVMRESTAVQTLTKDVEAQRQSFQAELKKKEDALREEDQTLAKQRSVLSASAFAEKRAELEKKIVEVQREVQELRRILDQRFGKGMTQVQTRLGEISKEIAEEKDLDLIISKATVVIVKPELEITKDAIERLNSQLPKVELPPAGQE